MTYIVTGTSILQNYFNAKTFLPDIYNEKLPNLQ